MHKILMVCMGNICRSPTAEAVMRHKAQQAGLGNHIVVDSAGTHGYHQGEAADERATAEAAKRGYDLSGLSARQVVKEDFAKFDAILAMDNHNLKLLQQQCPTEFSGKLSLLLSHMASETKGNDNLVEVPDPYYGGDQGFVRVLDLVELAVDGFLSQSKFD